MSYFVCKIVHLDPRFYSLIYWSIPGVEMSRVEMSGVEMSGVENRDVGGPDVPHPNNIIRSKKP